MKNCTDEYLKERLSQMEVYHKEYMQQFEQRKELNDRFCHFLATGRKYEQ